MNKKAAAYIMLTVSSIIFGFSFLFTKDALNTLGIFQLVGIRFLIAAAVMALLIAVKVIKIKITRAKLRSMLPLTLLQPLTYFVGETYGVKLTSASESGMMIAVMPIAIALFSIAILKERLILRQWISVFASVAGVVMIIGAGGFDKGSGNVLGYLLLLLAVLGEGLYSPLVKRITATCSPIELTFVMMVMGAVYFNIAGIAQAGVEGTLSTYFTAAFAPGVIGGMLYLAILSSVFAFFCINYALSKIKASTSASFCNLTTVVSVLAGVILGGENISALQIAGMALILLSIWGIVSERSPRISEEISEISIKS